jgi:UDP-perosamine 4-acetyltransferase
VESIRCGYSIVGLVDLNDEYNPNEVKNGYNVILNLKQLANKSSCYRDVSCFLAIGDNAERKKVYEMLSSLGFKLPYVVSGSAIVDRTVEIGAGNIIAHGVVVNAQVKIGINNLINTGAIIEHHCLVGNHIHLAPKSLLCGNVKVFANVFVGAGAIVLPQNLINRNSVVAAGSVVISSSNKEGIKYIGVPAREVVK